MRGQISLDFILALIIALVALGSVAAVGSSLQEMQKHNAVRQQLNSIGLGLAAVISTSAVLDDADTATITYSIPKIVVPGKEGLQGCDIEIVGSELRLSYEAFDIRTGSSETVEQRVPLVVPTGMQLSPELNSDDKGKCGEEITMTKS